MAAESTPPEDLDPLDMADDPVSNYGKRSSSLSDIPAERWEKCRVELPKILAEIGPTVPNQVAHVPATAAPELVVAYLHRDGTVIIDEAISEEVCDAVHREMQPYLDDTKFGSTNFAGKVTLRTGAVASRSPSSWPILAHPLLMDACAGVLGQQLLFDKSVHPKTPGEKKPRAARWGNAPGYEGHPFQLMLTQIIEIGPGEPAQALHRDRWIFVSEKAFINADLEPQLSSMWALTPFTAESGPTRVVPGSHRWSADHPKPRPEETAHAVMSKGSVLLYTGSAWHSGGNNVSTERRTGLNVDYSLGWLKQEENQILACPPHIAKNLPVRLQNLIGYVAEPAGYFDGGLSPKRAFQDRPVNWANQWEKKSKL